MGSRMMGYVSMWRRRDVRRWGRNMLRWMLLLLLRLLWGVWLLGGCRLYLVWITILSVRLIYRGMQVGRSRRRETLIAWMISSSSSTTIINGWPSEDHTRRYVHTHRNATLSLLLPQWWWRRDNCCTRRWWDGCAQRRVKRSDRWPRPLLLWWRRHIGRRTCIASF